MSYMYMYSGCCCMFISSTIPACKTAKIIQAGDYWTLKTLKSKVDKNQGLDKGSSKLNGIISCCHNWLFPYQTFF